MGRLTSVVESDRVNAVVSWVLVASLVAAAVASVVVGEPVWAVFVAAGLALVLLPAVSRRDPAVMPPWEVVVFVALPIASQFLALPDALADLTSFLAILGVAVLVVVELHEFTPVVMTPRFAVAFVVLVTMATAGVWTVVQYASDVWFGTALVGTKTTLMWDLVLATAVAVVAGPALAVYFRWLDVADVRGLAAGDGA